MEYQASDGALSEQLSTWWSTQTDFTTKKELAGFLKIHRDSLRDYFSGARFPKPDIATRIYQLTNIPCLNPCAGSNSSPGNPPEPRVALPTNHCTGFGPFELIPLQVVRSQPPAEPSKMEALSTVLTNSLNN